MDNLFNETLIGADLGLDFAREEKKKREGIVNKFWSPAFQHIVRWVIIAWKHVIMRFDTILGKRR